MNLGILSSQLNQALSEMRHSWEDSQARWDDGVRQEFEETLLDPLEKRMLLAKNELGKLAEVIAKARQECS